MKLFIVLAFFALNVAAQTFPTKPVRIVVPFTPGSATDIMARSVSDKLAAALGQPVLVENRPGAGGTIGTAAVAKGTPDGHTLAVVSAGHAINPVIYPNLPYDSARDLSAVIPLGSLPSILIVPPTLGVKSVAELIALAKAKPGELNFTTAGIGSASHASAEKFAAAAGIKAVHVPVKGAPEMVTETMTGRAQFALVGIVSAVSAINDGRLLGLAVSSPHRSQALPNVPTLAEAGLPQAEFNFWIGMLAPSQTPRPVIQRLHDEVEKILELAEVRGRLAKLGAEPMPLTPEQFDALIREDFATLGPLMRAAGVKGT